MKLSAGVVALLSISSGAALSVSRSDLRNLGSKSLPVSSGPKREGSSMRMEDFGLMKGTGIGFDDLWAGNEVISEVAIEKSLNDSGLRYRLNRTKKEAEEVGSLFGLPGVTLNLPIIGETYLGPPKVASIWEALGFTATSNNEHDKKKR